jgi:O-antigen ligase
MKAIAAMKLPDKNKVQEFLLLFFAFTIPLLSANGAKVMLVLLAFSVICFPWNSGLVSRIYSNSWDLLLYLACLSIGLAYTDDLAMGIRVIETSFSFLGIPLVFALNDKADAPHLKKIFTFFSAGVFVACVVVLVTAIYEYTVSGETDVFFYYRLTGAIKSHPTYLAYYLIFSLAVGLYNAYYEQVSAIRPRVILLNVFFCGMLILTGGHTAFVGLLLIFAFFILKYILEERTRSKNIVLATVVVMLVSMFLVNGSDHLSQRLALDNDYWERSALWEAAIKANSNTLVGVGTGDYQLVLNDYYRANGLEEFARENYNSHNQFIQIFLSNGLIGLISLIILLIRPLYTAMKYQDPLGILIFFPFLIYGINEVFLGRYQGVVFFVLFHQAYIIHQHSVRQGIMLKGS